MYEDFSFRDQVDPATTCVLANEVSDHLRIYMWGRVARTFLSLPEAGFAVATSCHADTVDDVLDMQLRDLRLPTTTAQRLGIIVNIGLVGRVWPPRRRFLTINFVAPTAGNAGNGGNTGAGSGADASASAASRFGVRLLPLARWDAKTDTQIPATPHVLGELAGILGMPLAELEAAVERRRVCLEQLAQSAQGAQGAQRRGVGQRAFREAVEALAAAEAGASRGADADAPDGTGGDDEGSE